ncbi:MAG TPA: MlaA family lipoprotein [Azospirillum sp.]|nr:MlaA family lipoprotein [Azospirillum sp.]
MRALLPVALLVLLLVSASGRPARADADSGGFNEWVYDANRVFAATVIRPVLEMVRSLPDPLPAALRNVYANVTEPVTALSHAMAGDPMAAGRSTLRFVVNSTAGVLGVFDVAQTVRLPAEKKRFSEGVCALGVPAGPYLVVPGFGPSSVGITTAAVVVMAGSTWALALVSMELAIASTLADLAGSAAALENAAALAENPGAEATGGFQADALAYRGWLADIGC